MKNIEQLNNLKDFAIKTVNQIEITISERPVFSNKIRKAIFFLFHEGISRTLKKINTSKKYSYQKKYITILQINFNEKSYINLSIQTQTNPIFFVIENMFYLNNDNNSLRNININNVDKLNQFTEINYNFFGIRTENGISLNTKELNNDNKQKQNGLFIFGIGGYIYTYVINNLRKINKIACIDYQYNIAKDFAKKYNFNNFYLVPKYALNDIKNTKIPYVIIATYHSDHSEIAKQVYNVNKNARIFIEKPPCVNLEDLETLINLYNKNAFIDIGFNRRYIPFSNYVKTKIPENKAVIINCSVKEVLINKYHWYNWDNQGTRVTGNGVHWIDLGTYWIKSKPVEINIINPVNNIDDFTISILYKNGSLLNLMSSDKGNSLRGVQELIEIKYENETIIINDFNKLTHLKSNGKKYIKNKIIRDKGHNRMYKHVNKFFEQGKKSNYTKNDLINTTVVTFIASKMIRENKRNMKIEDIIDKYHKI